MRKSEMTKEQIKRIGLMNTKLLESGWLGRPTNRLFWEENMMLPTEAAFDYRNESARLVYMYSEKRQCADIIMEDSVGKLHFAVFVGSDYDMLLDSLIQAQEELNCENYKAFILSVMSLYPGNTYLFRDDKLIRLKEMNPNVEGEITHE